MKFSDLPYHHALLLVTSNRAKVGETLFGELTTLSPVHRFFNQTVLDIDGARTILSWAQTPYNNQEKVAVISFHTIGLEAQNALLKMLEDPKTGVRFILVTSNKASIIDTVLSRVRQVDVSGEGELLSPAELFLKTKHTHRMKLPFIIDLLAKVDEEDRKDKESVRTFILSLSSALSKLHSESKYIVKTLDVASYASSPSASGKTLLEYLSLLLPQTKV